MILEKMIALLLLLVSRRTFPVCSPTAFTYLTNTWATAISRVAVVVALYNPIKVKKAASSSICLSSGPSMA